jgi:UPF0755 protein
MKKMPIFNRLSGKQKGLLLIIFLIPVFLLEILTFFSKPAEIQSKQKINVEIPRGAVLTQIADTLLIKNLISDKDLFVFFAKSLGYEKKLRAGNFAIQQGLNDYQVVKYLTTAKENTVSITLLEGWGLTQIANEVEKKLKIPAQDFLNLCFDSSFIAEIGLDVDNLEGYLLPDTYFFSKMEKASQVVRFLTNQTLFIFENDSVKKALKDLKLNKHQIITLASIVEGEALIDSERPIISSLYFNRLKKRMRLQADPTIQYIVEGPPKRLLNRDLKIDSPYNTYMYYGLPPGPINNPGKSSILATLFPESTNYLFMVAIGDGRHTFTRNLKEHINAKSKFDQVRRRVARERRKKGN